MQGRLKVDDGRHAAAVGDYGVAADRQLGCPQSQLSPVRKLLPPLEIAALSQFAILTSMDCPRDLGLIHADAEVVKAWRLWREDDDGWHGLAGDLAGLFGRTGGTDVRPFHLRSAHPPVVRRAEIALGYDDIVTSDLTAVDASHGQRALDGEIEIVRIGPR
jgi:hypothetical protein